MTALTQLTSGPFVPTRRTQYILLSHALGRSIGGGHIPNRVRMEQAMAKALGEGLCAPLHIKTLKSITGVSAFPATAYQFVKLLVAHRQALSRRGPIALVVDNILDVRKRDRERFYGFLHRLLNSGVEVLLFESCSLLMRLRSLQGAMSTDQAMVLHWAREMKCMPSETAPMSGYSAPLKSGERRPRGRSAVSQPASRYPTAAHA